MNKNTQVPSSTDQSSSTGKLTYHSVTHTHAQTYNYSTYQCFCEKHVITRGSIIFTFYCDFWVLLMYDILIILVCFLVPTRKAVKHKYLKYWIYLNITQEVFTNSSTEKSASHLTFAHRVKHALYSYFP